MASTSSTAPAAVTPTTTSNPVLDVLTICIDLCRSFEQIVLDRLSDEMPENDAKIRALFDDGLRQELLEQCKVMTDRYGTSGTVITNPTRCRGTSFVIGDDASSTTSSPSMSSGVHSATASSSCSEAGVQVDLLPPESASSPARPPPAVPVVSSTEDALVLAELRHGKIKHRMLEQRCSPAKAVELRRRFLADQHNVLLQALPYEHYDYNEVKDACCENVVGFVPLPCGVAGPLRFDDAMVYLPLSTTEGALVASVSRGCLGINESISVLGNDAFSVEVFRDGMSRAPVIEFPRIRDAASCLRWLQRDDTFALLKRTFEETSNYACLLRIDVHLEGTYLYLRFVASTGDAMGMNMVTKGTGRALALVKREFPQSILVSISGNMCVDKKPSALNWIEGRGKSVVAEAFIPAPIVERVLRTSVDKMVKLGHAKLLVGSSAAVTVGGWNAHAANVVAAMFLATGQDAAQVVSSSMCMTQLSQRAEDGALHVTCTMNCLEVGTIGGGTVLTPQGACLEMLGCRQAGMRPGQNAERLARLVCAAVLAGELSLLASQCTEGDLEKSHLRLNRSSRNLALSNSTHNFQQSVAGLSPSSSPYKKSLSMGVMREIPEHCPLPPLPPRHASHLAENVESPAEERSTARNHKQQRASVGDVRETRARSALAYKLRKIGSSQMPCGPL